MNRPPKRERQGQRETRAAGTCQRDVPPARAPAALHDFLEGLGVSTRFESYGVSKAESTRMIANALDRLRGKNFIGVTAVKSTTGAHA